MIRLLLSTAILASLSMRAAIPEGYYDLMNGKQGDDLKKAVKTVAHPEDYTVVKYQAPTWEAFKKTDVRTINGLEIWWDMYSNNLVTTDGHSCMNIEHSVANSWFGGKNAVEAYADLFHLNPSDQEANNQKSDLPLGEVETAVWQNGLIKTGSPKTGTCGGAKKVFEPADEYKGDFARAYLYVFTAYDMETWKTDQPMFSYDSKAELQPWALDMLLRWAKNDPVDSKEILRNEEIYKLQNNRNPFIDFPSLPDYLWGDLKGQPFNETVAASPVDRPEPPVFTGQWMTGVNTYSARWWDQTTVSIDHGQDPLWVKINDGDWQQYGPGVTVPAATSHGAAMSLQAYTETDVEGYTLRSSVARLSLIGKNPLNDDYSEAEWIPVNSGIDFQSQPSAYYILRSSDNGHVMGHLGGTSSTSYQPDAGSVLMDGPNVCRLPVEAAMVKFKETDNNKYLIEVISTIDCKSKGFWNVAGSGNKHTLKANTGTAASVSFDADGHAVIAFDGGKTLQYNAGNPRFTNYSSSQTPVDMARFNRFLDLTTGINAIEDPVSSEGCVAVDGHNVYLPQGWTLFSLNGRRSTGINLEPGIYIARSAAGTAVKIFIP